MLKKKKTFLIHMQVSLLYKQISTEQFSTKVARVSYKSDKFHVYFGKKVQR